MRTVFKAIAASLFATTALAEANVDLTILRPTIETTIVNGVEIETRNYDPVTSAIPGEVLTYRIAITNDGEAPVDDLRMVLPVDPSLTLLPRSLRSDTDANILVSVDSGDTFGNLDTLSVSRDGRDVPATPADITDLAITVPILSDKGTTHLEYDVRVD